MEHLSIRARRGSLDYLRVAQAYMLISMPTHTSAIFGVFQDMLSSKKGRRNCRCVDYEVNSLSRPSNYEDARQYSVYGRHHESLWPVRL